MARRLDGDQALIGKLLLAYGAVVSLITPCGSHTHESTDFIR